MKVGASFFCQNYFRAEKPDWQIYREDLELADMSSRSASIQSGRLNITSHPIR